MNDVDRERLVFGLVVVAFILSCAFFVWKYKTTREREAYLNRMQEQAHLLMMQEMREEEKENRNGGTK